MMQKSFQNKGVDGTYISRIVISDQNAGINENRGNGRIRANIFGDRPVARRYLRAFVS
jgi:hypothetical protein